MLEVSDGFGICRPLDGALSGYAKVLDRLLGEPRLLEVVRQQLWLCFNGLGELLFESVGDPAVKLLAFVPRQARIGGILYQRVLENVGRIRRFAPRENQVGNPELCKSSLERDVRHRRNGSEQPIREFSTNGGADLRDFLDLGEPIKA